MQQGTTAKEQGCISQIYKCFCCMFSCDFKKYLAFYTHTLLRLKQ